MNRAIAIAELEGPGAALALLEALLLDDYRYYHSTRAELLRRLGRVEEACAAYERALELTPPGPEQRFLQGRLAGLPPPPGQKTRSCLRSSSRPVRADPRPRSVPVTRRRARRIFSSACGARETAASLARVGWLAVGLAVAVALGACGSSVPSRGGSEPVGHRGGDPTVTTCGAPYTFVLAGRKLVFGTCAGTISEHPPKVRLAAGERFSLRITGATNANGTRVSRAFPVPKPSGSAVDITAVRGLSVFYRARAVGRSRLMIRSDLCPSVPRVSACSALDVVVAADGRRRGTITGPARRRRGAPARRCATSPPHTGPVDDSTAFAWGGVTPDPVVDVTLDGGHHWWSTLLPGTVLFVGNKGRELVANVYGTVAGSGSGAWAYVTRDGRHWSLLGSVASG